MRRLLCQHREWEPLDGVPTRQDGFVHLSWTRQRCLRCGKIRDGNLLKPGESISYELPLT